MRLQKYLSEIGFCSRRQAEAYIQAGKILVNGMPARLGDKVTGRETITVDGQRLQMTTPTKKMLIFNKPRHVECTLSAMGSVKTLLDFDFGLDRVFPVGSMDRETHGMLLMTNDGDLANSLAHPSRQHEEEYRVTVEQHLHAEIVKLFAKGTVHNTVGIAVHSVQQCGEHELCCVLHEGRSRYIRRICDAIGLKIIDCKRVRVGDLSLGDLGPGSWRRLTEQELGALRQSF